MSRCLVVGGGNFIGSNIVRRLVEQGMEVHILEEHASDLWRLHDFFYRIDIHRTDFQDLDSLISIIGGIAPDLVFNTVNYGCRVHHDDVERIYDVNFTSTINVLKACKKVGFGCFVNTGTSEEYGYKSGCISEDMAPAPRSHYGVANVAATTYCLHEALANDLPIYTVRPFCAFGDYESRSKLIGAIFAGMIRRVPVFLLSPEAARDFIYIDDLVDIYLYIARCRPTNYHIFNGGTGVAIRVIDVVEEIQQIFNQKIDVHWDAKNQNSALNKSSRSADMTRAMKTLSWVSRRSFREGLVESFEWFSKNFHMYKGGGERELIMSRL
ncbi:NAD-dependent epimerase/dehydratase family protein [Candidatus Babeliales bacterium]|nr:NAD-dependent epimerase/dehydratase family protein [Candidatus Babeliales bacterium]